MGKLRQFVVGHEWGLVLVLLVWLGSITAYVVVKEKLEWKEFSEGHGCEKVSETRSHSQLGIIVGGRGGVVVSRANGGSGWLCDDGITYWR